MKTALRVSFALALWFVIAALTPRMGPGHRCLDATPGASQYDPPHRCAP